MFDLIPFILNEHLAEIKSEIDGKFVGVIFDGTTHTCEALAVVIRFISDDFVIQQRLIGIQLLAKSLSGEEIAREVINLLLTKFGIGPNRLISAMRDRASANNVAIRTIKVVYSNVLDVGCFSHTLDLVGNYFKLPNLTEFFSTVGFCYSRTVSNVSFCGKNTLGKGWLLTARPGGGVNGKLYNKFWYSSVTLSHSCKKIQILGLLQDQNS